MPAIDFTAYVRPPRINTTSGVALAIRLLLAAPSDLDADSLAALEALRNAAAWVKQAVRDRHRSGASKLRPIDRRFDGAWAGLHGQLVAWTRLYDTPQATRATELLRSLFPTGLSFTNRGFEAQWIHSDMLLRRIDDEGLVEELGQLTHPKFLAQVRDHHQSLGRGLGLLELVEIEAQAEAEQVQVGDALVALAEAIADYGRILAGRVKLADPDSVARFEAALAPVDAHRAANRRAGGESGADEAEDPAGFEDGDEDEFDLDSPLPPLPGE